MGRAARAADAAAYRARIAGERQVAREREREQQRAYNRDIADARRVADARRATVRNVARGTATTITRGIGNAVGFLGRGAAIAGGLLGGFAVGNAVQSRIGSRAAAAGLANQAYGNPGETRSREQIAGDVERLVAALDSKTGIGEEQAVGGLRSFSAISGELGAAEKLLPFMVNLSDLADARIEDVGGAAGQVYKAVAKPGVSQEDALAQTKEILASLTQQTKIGSIELSDYAAHMIEITQAASKFTGKKSDLISFMSALAELNGYDAAEATTAIARIPDDLINHADEAKKILGGNGIFTDATNRHVRSPMELLPEFLEATQGDLTKTGKVFDVRSRKAFDPLQQTFVAAEEKKKGSGKAAVAEQLRPFLEANLPESEINKSAAFRQSQEDRQIARVMGDFNRAVGNELIPVITNLIPKAAELIPQFAKIAEGGAKLAGWFVENPFKGLGALVAVNVAADLASAGISSIVSSAMTRIMASVVIPGVMGAIPVATSLIGAGANAAGGALGLGAAGTAALGVAGAGVLAAGALYAAYDQNERTKKVTGGMGITDIIGDMWDQGTFDPFAVVEKHQNEQAKQEYKDSGREGNAQRQADAAAAQEAAARSQQDAAAQHSTAAAELSKSALALNDAAGKMGGGGDRRSAPLVGR
jgi:hypothetical protein